MKKIYLISCFILLSFSCAHAEYNLDALYSCARKLETPQLYENIIATKEEIESFYEYAMKYYGDRIPEEYQSVDRIKILFDYQMENKLMNPYIEILENIIQEMYKKNRCETDMSLPVGIIQNQPILQRNPSEKDYSLGTGLVYNRSFVITARHVLENSWYQKKKGEEIYSSGEFPKHVIAKQLENNHIVPLKKQLTYFPFKNNALKSELEKCVYIEDEIKYDGMNAQTLESTEITENGVDIGIASMRTPIDSEYNVSFSNDIPQSGKNLFTISIDKPEEGEEKIYLIPQSKILSFEQVDPIKNYKQNQKMFFLEKAMIPGNSGSAICASIEGKKILIYGVFNKKIEIVEDGKIKLYFAFSPIKDYIEKIKSITKEVGK